MEENVTPQGENNKNENNKINTKNTPNEQTNKFIVELLLNNIIYFETYTNQTLTKQEKEFIEKEIVFLEIPTTRQTTLRNSDWDDSDYYIKVNDLITNLQKRGYPITPKSKLFIRIKYFDDYVLINNENELIYISALSSKNKIDLKIKNFFENSLIVDTFTILKNHFLKNPEEHGNYKLPKLKIKDIVKLVYRYRFLSNGYLNEQKKYVKYSLKEAAEILKVSKSTLENYCDQIEEARKTNFNFNLHKEKPYSYLTEYNRIKTVKQI